VRSVLVVALDAVSYRSFELAAVPDDGVVAKLAAQTPNPAFRESLGDRCSPWIGRGLAGNPTLGSLSPCEVPTALTQPRRMAALAIARDVSSGERLVDGATPTTCLV
jgi:hypothetical protein